MDMAEQSPVTTAPPRGEARNAPHAGEATNGTTRDTRLRRAGPDVFGLLLVVAAAVAVMAPALIHGASLGPFDLLSQDGLTRQPGVVVGNGQMTDLIAEMIPWTSLAWTQIHHGQLPLWNPYNALGMPLAFNWQSAPFGIPALLGYLAPLRLAYTVQVMVTLVLAGTGVYVFGRVARLGVMACVMAGVVYELSGSFMGLLGWPIASVMAWTGWLFAAALLVVRGRHRARDVAFFAVVVACAVYAGQPDALVLLGAGLLVFLVFMLVLQARTQGGVRSVVRPVVDTALATVAGGALAAPLILPGIPLVTGSVFFHAERANSALSLHDVVNLVFQGFDALPVAQSHWFGIADSSYLGAIALVLAVTGAVMRRHQPEVLAITAVGVVMAALAFVPQLASVMNQLPFRARWHLGLMVFTFAVAILAGVGIDALIGAPRDWRVRLSLGAGFGLIALMVLGVWGVGRGHLPPGPTRLRNESFIWPAAATAFGLAVVAALSPRLSRGRRTGAADHHRRFDAGQWAAASLLIVETAFLIGVGTPLWSSSAAYLAPTPAAKALAADVGSSLVAFGVRSCELPPTVGILPETNSAFAVHELSAYDPITPRAVFKALQVAPALPVSALCPVIRTTAQARHFGVAFILEPRGTAGPSGTVFDAAVGHEALYRVPGAALATVTPVTTGAKPPGSVARGTPVAVTHPDPASWRLVTRARQQQVLRLALTDVPGWHASIDGRPLRLEPYSTVMLQARIPPGDHTVELHYWPGSFTLGIVLAACSLVMLALGLLVGWRRAGRRTPLPDPSSQSGA